MEGRHRRILRLRDRKKLAFGVIGERFGITLEAARGIYAAAKQDPGRLPDLSPRVRIILREHPPFAHAETAREIFELLPQIRLAACGRPRWPHGPKVKGFGPSHVQEIERWLEQQGFDPKKAAVTGTPAPTTRPSEAALATDTLATALETIADETWDVEARRLLREAARRLRNRYAGSMP